MKKVIFDVDGVLLSEARYFDVSALTLWEWFYSPAYMGLPGEQVHADLTEEEIKALRARFWKNDEILFWLKSHGVNDNWDMVHAVLFVSLWMMLEQYAATVGQIRHLSFDSLRGVRLAGILLRSCSVPEAGQVLDVLQETVPPSAGKNELFTALQEAAAQSTAGAAIAPYADLNSPLWQLHMDCFQNCYFGDELYKKTYGRDPVAPGKTGFLAREKPLAPAADILALFRELKRRGYAIAIATGRSYWEMKIPFETFGWLAEFDPLYISTSTDVDEAEEMLHQSLDKPNPFAYYLGAFGHFPEKYAAYVANPDAFKEGQYYVVGDSLADVWGAKAMGAVMIGTLTGLEKENARHMFEREGVTHVVDTVTDILSILE